MVKKAALFIIALPILGFFVLLAMPPQTSPDNLDRIIADCHRQFGMSIRHDPCVLERLARMKEVNDRYDSHYGLPIGTTYRRATQREPDPPIAPALSFEHSPSAAPAIPVGDAPTSAPLPVPRPAQIR